MIVLLDQAPMLRDRRRPTTAATWTADSDACPCANAIFVNIRIQFWGGDCDRAAMCKDARVFGFVLLT